MTSLKDELAKSVWWARMAEEVGPQVKVARVASRWRRGVVRGYGALVHVQLELGNCCHTGFEVWRIRGWQHNLDWPDALVKVKAATKIQAHWRGRVWRCLKN
jgi:hypothetical protein